MKNFVNLTLRAKLIISFGLIWIMLTAIVIIAYISIVGITNSSKELNDVQFTEALELQQLRSHQNFNRATILDMMLTNNLQEQLNFEKNINARADSINNIIDRLILLDSDAVFQQRIKKLKTIQNEYQETRQDIINLIKEGKKGESESLLTGIQAERFDSIRNLAVLMGKNAVRKTSDQLALNMDSANLSIKLFVIIGIISLIFSFFIIALLNKTVAHPLDGISILAMRIATGDLGVEITEDDRKDEVGVLNKAFYQMVTMLRGSIRDIIDGVNTLASSASEILAATTQVAAGSAETSTAISETTATVEEVRQASQLSSQKASRVAESSQQIALVSQKGSAAVDETVTAMRQIQNQMETIADTIVRLSEQSQKIGGIIASVNDVADQSNLLAVNAAIEAAKAGEQGKGFTVVAQEIKNLALQSKQATTQVRTILSDIQKATTAAVLATEQGSKAIENGVKQSNLSGESIKQLSKSVSESVQATTQIVASSQQQVVGMDQVGLAMTNINQAGAENAASMLQAERAAKDLNELGNNLKILVEQYKL